MALSSDSVWEIRTTGDDLNGGCFVDGAAGTDYSRQDSAEAAGTNLTVDATTDTDVLPDGHVPSSDDLGNTVRIQASAGWTEGFYQIESIQSGKWRLDRSPAAVGSTGAAWHIGGALASFGGAYLGLWGGSDSVYTRGHRVWIQAGTYEVDPSVSNGPGGTFVFPSSQTANNAWRVEGYETARGDLGAKPIIRKMASAAWSSKWMIYLNRSRETVFRNIEFDSNGQEGYGMGSYQNNGWWAERCIYRNFTGSQSNIFRGGRAWACEFYDCTHDSGIGLPWLFFCYLENADVQHCVAFGTVFNGGRIWANSTSFYFGSCTFHNLTLFMGTSNVECFFHCLFHSLLSMNSPSHHSFQMDRCAFWNTPFTPAYPVSKMVNWDPIVCTADPLVDPANGDFRLNDEAGGGALLRNGGFDMGFGEQVDIGAVPYTAPNPVTISYSYCPEVVDARSDLEVVETSSTVEVVEFE